MGLEGGLVEDVSVAAAVGAAQEGSSFIKHSYVFQKHVLILLNKLEHLN